MTPTALPLTETLTETLNEPLTNHAPAAATSRGGAAAAPRTLMDSVAPSSRKDAQGARAELRLVELAQRIRAVEQSPLSALGDIASMLERTQALHTRAREAVERRAYWLADAFAQQIEAELLLAADDDQRRSLFAALALQQPGLAVQLGHGQLGQTPSVAAVQLLLRAQQQAAQNESYQVAVLQKQIPTLLALLGGAIGFGLFWALAGGFEWLINEDIEISVAMIAATGMLLGAFGSLSSVLLDAVRPSARLRRGDTVPELRAGRAVLAVRVLSGAAFALPIVLFMQSGVLNVGTAPAGTLLLCFAGGFIERLFTRRLERVQ